MTDFSAWDKRASALSKAAEEEDAREKADNDRALGLQDGPKGPPVAKAEQQMEELGEHSKQRKEFIGWSKTREISIRHTSEAEPLELRAADVRGKGVRLDGSTDVTYIVPDGAAVAKLMLDNCKRVRLHVRGIPLTSTIELYRCEDIDVDCSVPVGTFQVDECTGLIRLRYAERDHVGRVYHQNAPGLELGWGQELRGIGVAEAVQLSTSLAPASSEFSFVTIPVRRGEGEFPVDIGCPAGGISDQPEPEALPEVERIAEQKRKEGNDMFRASDFLQAAMQYSQCIEMDPKVGAVWANRAQCWLKLGDYEKCLADATKCTELDPTNAKGWFRKGMSLHAMEKYPEAISALLEAEKLDGRNKQIPEAIRMAQLKARKQLSEA